MEEAKDFNKIDYPLFPIKTKYGKGSFLLILAKILPILMRHLNQLL